MASTGIVQTDEVKIKYESVEQFATTINNNASALGQNFKEEYRDLKSTIIACGNLEQAFSCEEGSRNTLKEESIKEYNNLSYCKDKFETVDSELAKSMSYY